VTSPTTTRGRARNSSQRHLAPYHARVVAFEAFHDLLFLLSSRVFVFVGPGVTQLLQNVVELFLNLVDSVLGGSNV
jgi:hypothetical protein